MKLETFTAIPPAIMENTDLSQSEKLIYGIVLGYTLASRKCFASNAFIGKSIGVSEEGARKCLRSLEKKGFIERKYDHQKRLELRPILEGVVQPSQGGGTTVPHTILGTKLDSIINNTSKDVLEELVPHSSEKEEYGNKDINSLKNVLILKYPADLSDLSDRRRLQHLLQACKPRKGKDKWMDKDWKVNFTNFLKPYLEGTDGDYLVKSVRSLKVRAQSWREAGGYKKEKSVTESKEWD